MVYCPACNKELKSEVALRSHTWKVHTDSGKQHIPMPAGTHVAWNKGLSKDTDDRVKRNGDAVSKTICRLIDDGKWVTRKPNAEFCQELSIQQSLNNKGGKCKWFEYNGQKLQGTWELNIAKKLDELFITWLKLKTNNDVLTYVLDGKIKSYTPDLYLPQYDIYLEIKGYWWGNDKRKMDAVYAQHPDKRIILIENDQYQKLMHGELVW